MSSSRKPEWLKTQPPSGREFADIRETLREQNLHTVCEEANCPNLGECWSGRSSTPASSGDAGGGQTGGGTATFMLLGDRCSRGCNFCDVETGGMEPLDPDEPENVASAVAEIGLDYVVLTSVDRDDLPDQGAGQFAATIREIKRRHPGILVEVLIPDFQGEKRLLEKIIDAEPDVIAHNVETVERLQYPIRDRRAGYEQSLGVLEYVDRNADIYTKTSIMLGHGEYDHEVYQTLADLRERGVDIVTLGQYLQPSRSHLDVKRYDHPDKYETWRRVAEEELGYLYCASGPMVRSSYKAGELFVDAVLREGESVERARECARGSHGSRV
ncbi:lipoyl synthase [Halostagnicola sp. A-GB9-2]|uniref:lipoyl synthase n=1 Tax=Halostagnicola sp. A-GB9-2 TaxID=3048066 RepID=UPI0024BF2D87|nr:lipoyl synthase [Halostagnicola sp. A-GB9-2]MDJ1432606.1 lipoyl synthase [Halostagnicola sp. A-GB9-2]